MIFLWALKYRDTKKITEFFLTCGDWNITGFEVLGISIRFCSHQLLIEREENMA